LLILRSPIKKWNRKKLQKIKPDVRSRTRTSRRWCSARSFGTFGPTARSAPSTRSRSKPSRPGKTLSWKSYLKVRLGWFR
jgi:hypothetical protein